ncbi:hypothetical protein [uncultured Pontibacter sp.]|nr:hypothetical protein [uncultured Pontibacter sp.]
MLSSKSINSRKFILYALQLIAHQAPLYFKLTAYAFAVPVILLNKRPS